MPRATHHRYQLTPHAVSPRLFKGKPVFSLSSFLGDVAIYAAAPMLDILNDRVMDTAALIFSCIQASR